MLGSGDMCLTPALFNNSNSGLVCHYRALCYRRIHHIRVTIVDCMFHFHDLRHSYAVISLKSGDDVKTVQENLGHATAAFTLDVYGHVTEKMKKDSANRMEAFIKSVS